jgi:hypothetical protein
MKAVRRLVSGRLFVFITGNYRVFLSYIDRYSDETVISIMVKKEEIARLKVMVKPKSSRQAVTVEDDTLVVWVNTPPVEGKANAMCLRLVAEWLGVAKSNLTILSGARQRQKLIGIANLTQSEVLDKLRQQ